jgi:cell division protein FtsB
MCLASALAHAQVQRSGGDAGAARLMQQLQQLQAQQAEAQAQSDKLKQENDSLKQQLQKLQGDQGALAQRAATLEAAARRDAQASRDSATATENLRGQMQELITRFRETAQNLKDVETDRTKIRGDLAAREQDLKACGERNAKLYELNAELLDHMEHRGFWAAVAEREPFTRIARTRLQNLAEDYRGRAEELRQPPPKSP